MFGSGALVLCGRDGARLRQDLPTHRPEVPHEVTERQLAVVDRAHEIVFARHDLDAKPHLAVA